MKIFKTLLILIALVLGAWGFTYTGYQLGVEENLEIAMPMEWHGNCIDDKQRTAWIAKRGKEYRCFHEYKEYPHRARGSAIDKQDSKPGSH
jgi:hypothetical protein